MYRIQSNMTFMRCLFCSWDYAVWGVPVDDTCDPWSCNSWRKISCQTRSCRHQIRRSAWCPVLCAGFCSEAAHHTEKFLLRVRLDNVVWVSCGLCGYNYIKSGLCPVECCGVSICEPSHHLCACLVGSGCVAARTAKDTSERWYLGGNPRSETASRSGVGLSDIVEEGRVEYVPVASPTLGPPGPSKIRSSRSKRKRKISRSHMKLPWRYKISSPFASP